MKWEDITEEEVKVPPDLVKGIAKKYGIPTNLLESLGAALSPLEGLNQWSKFAGRTILSPFYKTETGVPAVKTWTPQRAMPGGELEKPYANWQAPWGVKGGTELLAMTPSLLTSPARLGLKGLASLAKAPVKVAPQVVKEIAPTVAKKVTLTPEITAKVLTEAEWRMMSVDARMALAEAAGLPEGVGAVKWRALSEQQKVILSRPPAIPKTEVGMPEVIPPTIKAIPTKVTPVVTKEGTIVDPIVNKVLTALKQTKIARKVTKVERKVELGKRVGLAEAKLEEIEKPAEAWAASKAQLAGKMPTTTPLIEAITPDELANMRSLIINNKSYSYFDRLHADTGLMKIFSSDKGELAAPHELRILKKMFSGIEQLNIEKYKMNQSTWTKVIDALNLPRAQVASTDLSMTLNQGMFLLGRFPQELIPTVKWQLKTLFSEKNAQLLDDMIYADPETGLLLQMGWDIRPLATAISKIGQREEFYMSSLANKLPWIRMSNRAFVSGANYLTWRAGKRLLNVARNAKSMDDNTLQGLMKLVNWAGGRGTLPNFLKSAGPILNAFLFAPRWAISRLELPTLLWHSSPVVRKEAFRTLAQTMGAMASVMTLAHFMGARVPLNQRASDFGKIIFNNTRLNVSAGYIQWIRFVNQLIFNERETTTGTKQQLNRLETVWRLIQSKEAPLASIITDLLMGKNYVGETLTEGGWDTVKREARDRLTPLFVQDMWDAIQEDGWGIGTAEAMPSLFGIGVQTFKPKGFGGGGTTRGTGRWEPIK